jgi:glyoxylase-like metal-dependent hydrolase (beta-lactamase superfamily II)
MHWDHVSALSDFPQAPLLVRDAERQGAEDGRAPGFLRSQFASVRYWQTVPLSSGPWMGFPQSQDLFGDGSAVLVPLGGHTAGQVGLVLRLPSGRCYPFTGDVSWTMVGLRTPADRSWLLRHVVHVDGDTHANQLTLLRLHQLMRAHPELQLVPSHDEQVAAQLPQFPNLAL